MTGSGVAGALLGGVGLLGVDAGQKAYRNGTHRTVAPAATVARVEPLMSRMGMTRIANITGLDRLGIPVVVVCRPNSRSLAVSQGKGLTLEAAKASALMESVETYHAETFVTPLILSTYRELRRSHPVLCVEDLPQSQTGRFHEDVPLLWAEGRELISGSACWLPYEVVHTDYTLPPGPACGSFPANTNGLASGNHFLEAVSHGLCEIVERDANTLWLHATDRRARALRLDTVDDEACRDVLDRFARANVEVLVWDTTSDVGIASFYSLVMGRGDDWVDPEFGGGCHPARSVALLRALTEAAQARTTFIAGSRDDLTRDLYTPSARKHRLRNCLRLKETHAGVRSFHDVPNWDGASLLSDVEWVLGRLRSVGTSQVAVVDLTKWELGLPVARVVIPGLEGPDKGTHGDYVPGPRARAARRRRA